MTRREKIVAELGLNEIVQESIKRHPRFADKRVGFIDGAEWMQKKMVEKACEWLKKWTYQDCLGVSPIARLKVGFSSVEELVDAFKQAMED